MAFSVDKVFPPYPKEDMQKQASRNTICDTLRKVYRELDKPNPNIEDAQYKIRIAVTMAKRMSKKLKSYSPNYGKNFFPKKDK